MQFAETVRQMRGEILAGSKCDDEDLEAPQDEWRCCCCCRRAFNACTCTVDEHERQQRQRRMQRDRRRQGRKRGGRSRGAMMAAAALEQ